MKNIFITASLFVGILFTESAYSYWCNMPDCDCPGSYPCTKGMNSAACCFAKCQCKSPCYCGDANGRARANLCTIKCFFADSTKKMPSDVETKRSLAEVTLKNEAKLEELENRIKKLEVNKKPQTNEGTNQQQ